MKDKRAKILNRILPLVTVLVLILVWALAGAIVNSQYILPSVKLTAEKFFALFFDKTFYSAFFLTLLRSLIAFIFSFAVAFVLAIFSTKFDLFKSAVSPIISVMRALPTIAVVLLLLFWTNSQVAPVIVTTLVVLPTLYTHIESAFFALDKTIAEAGRVDGADEIRVFTKIQLPQAMPSIYSGIGGGISLNFKLMVAAEVIAQTANSIGYLLNTSKVYFEIAQMLATVCVAVIFGVIVEFIFNRLSKKVSDWK